MAHIYLMPELASDRLKKLSTCYPHAGQPKILKT